MILHGNIRSSSSDLIAHLTNERDNDHMEIHELKGFVSTDFANCIYEIEAISKGTRATKPYYALALNPPPQEKIGEAEFERAINQAEAALGLTAQPRAIIFHEKKGRRHAHVVWSRIDSENMKVIHNSNDWHKLAEVSRSLFIEHGWDMPEGLKKDGRGSPDNTSRAEQEIAKRSGLTTEDHKKLIRRAWQQSDNVTALGFALEQQGYLLAEGQRGYVGVDIYTDDVHVISRAVGLKKKEVEQHLGPPYDLPDVGQAKIIASERRKAIAEALKVETVKASGQSKVDNDLEALKEEQRAERRDLNHKQNELRKAQERSFVERLSDNLKRVWDVSRAKLVRLRDEWFGKPKQKIDPEHIVTERSKLEKTSRQQRDHLRQGHLAERRQLDAKHKAQVRAERQAIIDRRKRFAQTELLKSRKDEIRIKFERDKSKSRDLDR